MAGLIPIIVSAGSLLFGWLERRRLISAAFAASFYAWVDSLGTRQKIPAELRQKVLDQRARLDAKEGVPGSDSKASKEEK